MIGSSVEYGCIPARLYRTKCVDRCEKFCLISMSLVMNDWFQRRVWMYSCAPVPNKVCRSMRKVLFDLNVPGNEWLVPASSMDVFLRACTEQSLSIDAKSFVWSQCPCYFQVTNDWFQRRVWMYSCAPVPNKVCRSMRKVLFDLNVPATSR